MKYEWDIKKIKILKQKYYKLLLKSFYQNHYLKEKFIELKELENFINPPIISLNHSRIKYLDKQKYLSKESFEDYFKISKEIKSLILKTLPIFANFKEPSKIDNFSSFPIANKGLIELSHDFFKWLPRNSYISYFNYFTNPNNNLINFFDDYYLNILGLTSVFFYPTYTPLFEIFRTKTIQDFLTINHELAHGIFYKDESIKSQTNNHYFILELEGYFFDFLSIEYLKEKKIIDLSTLNKLELSECLNALDCFINFIITSFMINKYNKLKKIDIKAISEFVFQYNLLDSLSFYHEENPLYSAKYSLSYLVSLNLEKIYQQDKEYAFYLFEKIRCNKTNDIIKNLRLHNITFMDDNYQNLRNKLRTLKIIP